MERFKKLYLTKIERHLDTAVKVVSNVADVVVHLKTPSVLGMTLVAARTLKTYREISERYKNWIHLTSPAAVFATVRDCVAAGREEDLKSGDPLLMTIGDYDLLIKRQGDYKGSYDIRSAPPNIQVFAPPGANISEYDIFLEDMFWEHTENYIDLTNENLNLPDTERTQRHPCSDFFKLRDRRCLSSDKAQEILEYLFKVQKGNECRVLLLYGEPGTGKSEILKYIALKMGLRTIKFDPSGRGYSFIDLNFDIAILDDFDLYGPTQLDGSSQYGGNKTVDVSRDRILGTIGRLKAKCKFIFVSANDISKFPAAVLRSGRFDDIFKVDKLDQTVIDRLLEGVPPDLKKKLEDLPVSYLSEFKHQKDTLEIQDLQELTWTAENLIARSEMVSKLLAAQKNVLDSPKT